MSEWVSEAQRIAREAAEVTAKELLCRANHAMGWLVEGCPSAAQLVLESLVLRRPPPDGVMLAQAAEKDRKRNEAKANEVALNERLSEARDAALEEAAALYDARAETCRVEAEKAANPKFRVEAMEMAETWAGEAEVIRALKGRK